MIIRKLVLAIFCSMLSVYAYADCIGSMLSVFPTGYTINQNSIFMLEGYGSSQEVIKGLNKKFPIYLLAGKNKVELTVKEICVGQFELTQAILIPKTKLIPGLEYKMIIENLPEYEVLEMHNYKTGKRSKVKYKVSANTDTDKPVVYSNIRELERHYAMYGCGPAKQIIFNMPVKDKSEFLIKTSVYNIKTGKRTTYYLMPEENKIKVGHEMCSGAFTFYDGKNYRVNFAFMDASGNVTEVKEPPIKFIWLEGS